MNKWCRVLLPAALAAALLLTASACSKAPKGPAEQGPEVGTAQKIPVRKPCTNRNLNLEEMVRIPAGKCMIGGPSEDKVTQFSSPAHSVTTKEFWIDKYEVTNKQFMEFCKQTGYRAKGNWMDYYQESNNPLMPVLGVSLSDATEYAKWAGKRLPSNDEWEKAASWDEKAGKARRYPWGDTWELKKAHTQEDATESGGPVEVGLMEGDVSAYGVNDMLGNVFEWTVSRYDKYAGCKQNDPAFGGAYSTVKGASYAIPGAIWWLAARSPFETGNLQGQGFRCASDVAPESIKRGPYTAPAPEKIKKEGEQPTEEPKAVAKKAAKPAAKKRGRK